MTVSHDDHFGEDQFHELQFRGIGDGNDSNNNNNNNNSENCSVITTNSSDKNAHRIDGQLSSFWIPHPPSSLDHRQAAKSSRRQGYHWANGRGKSLQEDSLKKQQHQPIQDYHFGLRPHLFELERRLGSSC